MISTKAGDIDPTSIELATQDAEETFQEGWFADQHSESLPPPRMSSVPPMGDDDVDPWLR